MPKDKRDVEQKKKDRIAKQSKRLEKWNTQELLDFAKRLNDHINRACECGDFVEELQEKEVIEEGEELEYYFDDLYARLSLIGGKVDELHDVVEYRIEQMEKQTNKTPK